MAIASVDGPPAFYRGAALHSRGAASFAPPLAILLDTGGGAGDFLVLDHTCLRGDAQHAFPNESSILLSNVCSFEHTFGQNR